MGVKDAYFVQQVHTKLIQEIVSDALIIVRVVLLLQIAWSADKIIIYSITLVLFVHKALRFV